VLETVTTPEPLSPAKAPVLPPVDVIESVSVKVVSPELFCFTLEPLNVPMSTPFGNVQSAAHWIVPSSVPVSLNWVSLPAAGAEAVEVPEPDSSSEQLFTISPVTGGVDSSTIAALTVAFGIEALSVNEQVWPGDGGEEETRAGPPEGFGHV
jgi:hypothetical protein